MRALSVDVECVERREPADRRGDACRRHRGEECRALTLPIVRELVSDILLVDEPHLERAVNAFLTLQKTMAEGAGAAGLAALLAEPSALPASVWG